MLLHRLDQPDHVVPRDVDMLDRPREQLAFFGV